MRLFDLPRRRRALAPALALALVALGPAAAYGRDTGTYCFDLGVVAVSLVPPLELSSKMATVRGEQVGVGTAALFGAFGLDWRASRDDGLYIPLAGFHAGFSVLRGAHDASDGLGNRLHLGVPFYVEVLGPGAGWHWLSADHGTRISLGARLAMPVLFAFGDVLAPSLERQDLSALAWGLGATGEVQACHRIWKETSGWSGLCFLGQAGFAYGSGGPVISVTLAFRLSVG